MALPAKFHVKRGDVVQVIRGDAKGQKGKVLQIVRGTGRAVVEGVNLVKRHTRKTQERPEGGILEKEAALPVSALRQVESATGRPEPKKADGKSS